MVYEFERAAMRGKEMPDGLSRPDQWMYLSLRLLYRSIRTGVIDLEQGKREKRSLEAAYQHMLADEKYAKHLHGMYNRIDLAGAKYNTERTLEMADRLYGAVYNMPSNPETPGTGGQKQKG